jgi:hypothetical protein
MLILPNFSKNTNHFINVSKLGLKFSSDGKKLQEIWTPLLRLREGSLNHSSEVIKMGNEKRLATPKQLEYIERLCMGNGETIDRERKDLTMAEASELIAGLLQKASNGKEKPLVINREHGNRRNDFGNSARLGMAFKCCYRRWIGSGKNIFKYRNDFIQNVLDTFDLINEIADKALQSAS